MRGRRYEKIPADPVATVVTVGPGSQLYQVPHAHVSRKTHNYSKSPILKVVVNIRQPSLAAQLEEIIMIMIKDQVFWILPVLFFREQRLCKNSRTRYHTRRGKIEFTFNY